MPPEAAAGRAMPKQATTGSTAKQILTKEEVDCSNYIFASLRISTLALFIYFLDSSDHGYPTLNRARIDSRLNIS